MPMVMSKMIIIKYIPIFNLAIFSTSKRERGTILPRWRLLKGIINHLWEITTGIYITLSRSNKLKILSFNTGQNRNLNQRCHRGKLQRWLRQSNLNICYRWEEIRDHWWRIFHQLDLSNKRLLKSVKKLWSFLKLRRLSTISFIQILRRKHLQFKEENLVFNNISRQILRLTDNFSLKKLKFQLNKLVENLPLVLTKVYLRSEGCKLLVFLLLDNLRNLQQQITQICKTKYWINFNWKHRFISLHRVKLKFRQDKNYHRW